MHVVVANNIYPPIMAGRAKPIVAWLSEGRAARGHRQLDTEGGEVRIVNGGSPPAILGLKTEGVCTVLENRNGARSVIHGGLLYMVRDMEPLMPAFINADGTLLATLVEESLRSASRYAVYLRDPRREVRATEFPARGYGRIVP